MKALVTGATGFVGRQLVGRLRDPKILTRNSERARQRLSVEAFDWDPLAGTPPASAFDGVNTVFHLAGEPVAEGRWTGAKKERIRSSRVLGTQNLVAGLAASAQRPATLVSASAIGYYGSKGDALLDESAAPSTSFLGQVTQDWESSALAARELGMRVVCVRIGIVLGPGGGALASMLPLFKIGAGGRLGDGRQWMSWIDLDDLIALMLHAATEAQASGPINGVSPNPVTNRDFTRELARALHRPAIFPAPAFALRLALGEFADVLLSSQRVVPRAAINSGFSFKYPTLQASLEHILAPPDPGPSR